MSSERIIGAVLALTACLAIGFLAPSWGLSEAQIVAPDQMIGPQPEESAPLTEGVIVIPNDEPTTRGLEPGFERPLDVPDRFMEGEETRLPLRTPDQLDADNVRESDEKSALAF
ncbi:MAG TPA: hypothetical protein VHF07_04375 [Nitrospiraceae bacterium]|nr:hypothetical protein [Nitrospiraceae bacterium]